MKIKSIIEFVDERNEDGKNLPLLGLSMNKCFIPSVANTVGTDMTKYKIIRSGLFATNFIHVGRDAVVPIALYSGEESIVSSAYSVFRVADENMVMPEYLNIYFNNSEFDREAAFYASAGIRGGLDMDDFINMELPVPPIEEQRRIVSQYQSVERRIANNEALIQKLEATAQALYHHTFVENIDPENLPEGWRMVCLKEIAEINPSRPISKTGVMPYVEMDSLSTVSAFPRKWAYKEFSGGMRFKNGDTILARITPCLENGKAAYINFLKNEEVAFGSTEYIVISSKGQLAPEFFYFLSRNNDFIKYAVSNMNGSSGRQRVSGTAIGEYKMVLPSPAICDQFSNFARVLISNITSYSKENMILKE